jgi:hypothetical protein
MANKPAKRRTLEASLIVMLPYAVVVLSEDRVRPAIPPFRSCSAGRSPTSKLLCHENSG